MTRGRIVWGSAYEIGIEEIDLQHHYFVALINRLRDELGSDDPEYRARLIQELDAYAKFHFISEENLMYRVGYPGLEAHALQHFALIDALSVKQVQFGQGETSVDEIIDFLGDWFVGHTRGEDRRIAEFIAGKDAR